MIKEIRNWNFLNEHPKNYKPIIILVRQYSGKNDSFVLMQS